MSGERLVARYPVPGGEPPPSLNIPSGPALEAFLRGLEPPPPEPVDYSPLGSITSPRTERVLIVDDDPDIARFIEVNLRSVGFADTLSVGDGLEALARAQGLRPDLILTDVNRPGMDGFSFVQALRQMTATARCAIVFLTVKALTTDRAVGLALGADDYMIKPFDPIELIARVNSALRRTAQRRADQVGPSRVISPLEGSEARSSAAADYLSSGLGLEMESARDNADPHIAIRSPFLYELGERASGHLYEEAQMATDPSCTAMLLGVRARAALRIYCGEGGGYTAGRPIRYRLGCHLDNQGDVTGPWRGTGWSLDEAVDEVMRALHERFDRGSITRRDWRELRRSIRLCGAEMYTRMNSP